MRRGSSVRTQVLAGIPMHLSVVGVFGKTELPEPIMEHQVDDAHLRADIGLLNGAARKWA